MAFLCLSFVACFITWKIFFSRNTAGKYLSLDLAISLFLSIFLHFTSQTEGSYHWIHSFPNEEVKANLVSITCTMYTIHMFSLFYPLPFVSIVSVSHFYSKFVPVSFFWRQFPISYRKVVDGLFSISFFLQSVSFFLVRFIDL